MDNKLVSIITPMYKGAAFVGETIESVQAQSYQDWEMIIVDDCSPDAGAGIAVVKRYAQNDPRIILIESKENKGSSGARNIALRVAKGRYIAFLDSDDLWPADYLQSQVNFLDSDHGHVIAYSATQMFDEETKEYISTTWNRPLKTNYRAVLCECPICPSATVYDSNKCHRQYFFNESLGSMRDDWVFFLDMLKDIPWAHYNKDVTILYRVRKQAVTKAKYKIIPSQWKILRKVENLSFFRSVYCLFYWGVMGIKKFYIR